MNSSSINRELLISEVQSRPVLWQDTHKNFKNRNITDKLWEEVGNACGISGTLAKNKWKNLKDQYRREKQKIPSFKSGSKAEMFKSKWHYFKMMSFLKDYIAINTMEGNLHSENIVKNIYEAEGEVENDFVDVQDCDTGDTDSPVHTQPAMDSTLKNPSHHSFKRKKCQSEFNERFLEIQQKKMELLEKEINENNTDIADLQFFKSLLPFMEPLSIIDKLEIRNKIQEIIINKYREIEQQQSIITYTISDSA